MATTSALAQKLCVSTHYVSTNIAFARGGAHLPITHAYDLGSKLKLRKNYFFEEGYVRGKKKKKEE